MASLPSLLVFGPQTGFPSDKALLEARQELLTNPNLRALKEAVDDLPQFWQELVDHDSALPGDNKYLHHLKQWANDGGSLPFSRDSEDESTAPSHYALAVTVLLHITQYTRYLGQLGGQGSHRKLLESVSGGGGGIQGFCVGLLSALAVATSASESDIGASAAVALRLAVCIGAYVDQDRLGDEFVAVALRWADGLAQADVADIIRSIPDVR
jgi:hypothetical protein